MAYQVSKSDHEWREQLDADQYSVLREAATERPWTGELLDEERAGVYACAACGAELFKSGTKFDSGCADGRASTSRCPRGRRAHRGHLARDGAHRGPLRRTVARTSDTCSPTGSARPRATATA